METCSPAVPSHIGGADLTDIERMALPRLVEAPMLADHGRVRFRKAGEHHAYNPLAVRAAQNAARTRSEEHTSELQSHLNIVCRLLLEKKKKIKSETKTS